MAKWETITDDFPGTTLGANWNPYGTRSVSGNKLRFPITGSNYAGATDYGNDLTDSFVMARVEPGTSGYAGIEIYTSGTIRLRIQVNGSNLEMRIGPTTVATITYSPTDHAWMRIREAAGTSYLETSPDGTNGSWTERASGANPVVLTNCDANLIGGGGSAGGGEAMFSKFNLVPAGGSGASVSPGRIEGVASVYAPSVAAAAAGSPARIEATALVPSPSYAAGAAPTVERIAALALVPQPAVAGSSAPPTALVLASAVVYAPTLLTGSGAVVAPSRIEAVASIPTPTPDVLTGVVAPLVLASAYVGAADLSAGATGAPSALVAVARIYVPTPRIGIDGQSLSPRLTLTAAHRFALDLEAVERWALTATINP